ncbi:MAG: peptidylprolyl isomerase [Planctomycetes bacterium]|nr:peptidylprolyl isomerase [Planctomycetota bacterium]
MVPLVAGTRLERRLSFPCDRLVPNVDPNAVTPIAVAWDGLAGANCVLKVAPDSRKLDLAALDFAKTKVVLVTNLGELTLAFRPDKAPRHVENFLKLCKAGFYDGTKFHRVVRNFMIQGGDPNSKNDDKPETWGQGDPGYKIDAEFNDLKHLRGTLSMARSNDPNSAGSQFFLVHKDSAHLDGKYSAFGNLEKGADVLDAIANVRCGGPQDSTPLQPVVLLSTVILPVKK